MRNVLSLSALLATLALGGAAMAQTPAPPPTAPPAQPSLRHSHPMIPATGTAPIAGGFVGNKKTHVYHAPGDKGSLPATQNRVYFHTEAEAVAAGYHKAGSTAKTAHPKTPKPAVKPAP